MIDLPDAGLHRQGVAGRADGHEPGAKLGIRFASARWPSMPRGLQMQVRAISSEWVEDKGLPEMGFTLGGVDEALDPHVRVGLAVDADATVHGVTSWMPVHDAEAATRRLDPRRHAAAARRLPLLHGVPHRVGLPDLPATRAAPWSPSPARRWRAALPPAGDEALDRGTLDSFLDRLGGTLEPYYGFRSLHAFKSKFQPRLRAALPRLPRRGRAPAHRARAQPRLPAGRRDARLRDPGTLESRVNRTGDAGRAQAACGSTRPLS